MCEIFSGNDFENRYMGCMRYFPPLPLENLYGLLTLKQALDADADMLDDPNCPYDTQMRHDLKALFKKEVIEVEVEKVVEIERIVKVIERASEGGGKRGPKVKTIVSDDVEIELREIIDDLKVLKVDSREKLPSNERIAVMKLRTTLLEKLIMLRDKATNMRKVSAFMSTVMTVMDELLDDDQRQLFMKRIEPFTEAE